MSFAINVIEASTPEAYDYLLYPEQHPSTYQFIQNQFENEFKNMGSSIMESGKQFLHDSKVMFEKFYDSSIERTARAAIRIAKNLVHPNNIQRYDTLEDIQCAQPLMQRYIMTEPYLREKFHQQLCSGYAGTYVDLEPGLIKEKHYDWRRVNDGIIRFEGEGDDEEWVATNYFEDLREGDRELKFEEKIDILYTSQIARMYAENGYDPTDPWGNSIG